MLEREKAEKMAREQDRVEPAKYSPQKVVVNCCGVLVGLVGMVVASAFWLCLLLALVGVTEGDD